MYFKVHKNTYWFFMGIVTRSNGQRFTFQCVITDLVYPE
jgi:hypothetical protein